MRVNDEVTADYILDLETDNDHLRVENDELQKELEGLKAEIRRLFDDRNYSP